MSDPKFHKPADPAKVAEGFRRAKLREEWAIKLYDTPYNQLEAPLQRAVHEHLEENGLYNVSR